MAYALPHRQHRTQVQVASGLDVLAAIWLFISAFVVAGGPTMAWNNIVLGVIVFILAACRAFGAYRQAWISWVNAVLGIWVVIAPWVLLGTPSRAIIWNNVITGAVVIVFAIWSAAATNTGSDTNAADYSREPLPPARP